jgi:hypothetical protein
MRTGRIRDEVIAAGINSTPMLVNNGKIVRSTGKYEELKLETEAVLAEA